MEDKQEAVRQIRAFNRFYTVLLGFLNRDYFGSGYSVTETRILFELKQGGQMSASQLIDMLHLDKSYISRLIRSLEQKALLTRHPSEKDGRARILALTPAGQAEADRLIEITNSKLYELVAPLSGEACDGLCQAMDTIIRSLGHADL